MNMHQPLPRSGDAREKLRQKGQFWTPAWVAEAMVAYPLAAGCSILFDPAVGAGAFLLAAKKVAANMGRDVALSGAEIDPAIYTQAHAAGLTQDDLSAVHLHDFVMEPPAETFPAIVANPPYIRHHRLSADTKTYLKHFSRTLTGLEIDGRAGYHVYFLLRALEKLATGGHLAFIVPADICEGVFAAPLWQWIARRYRLDAIVTFSAHATPFPGVDTNPLILMLQNALPAPSFKWAQVKQPGTKSLYDWVVSSFAGNEYTDLDIMERQLNEGLATGLSRAPCSSNSRFVLGDFARTMRGIATGGNEFFCLTREQVEEHHISPEFLVRCVGRTRDVSGDTLTASDLETLDKTGRTTWLLNLDARALTALPEPVKNYILSGEAMGLPERALIKSRRPWYKMETRLPPPFLFAYLGRRNARFIRNTAGAVPLTGFLCVYPHHTSPQYLESLWLLLKHPDTLDNLNLVGKSYGGGAIKVEPRALERLPLSDRALQASGLLVGAKASQREFAFA